MSNKMTSKFQSTQMASRCSECQVLHNWVTSPKHLLKTLECPVCMDIFSNRIFICLGGHSICESCKNHIAGQICPLCQEGITELRNYALESVVNEILVECKFKDEGCVLLFKPDELQEHLKECDFRDIMCTEYGICENRSFPFGTFLQHLFVDHVRIPKTTWTWPLQESDIVPNVKAPVYSSYLHFDQKWFILSVLEEGSDFLISLVCMGSQEESKKYEAAVIIGHPDDTFNKTASYTICKIESIHKKKMNQGYYNLRLQKEQLYPLGHTNLSKRTVHFSTNCIIQFQAIISDFDSDSS